MSPLTSRSNLPPSLQIELELASPQPVARVLRRRGLSEPETERLLAALRTAVEERTSLYDVFAAAEAFLHEMQEPETVCPICLVR